MERMMYMLTPLAVLIGLAFSFGTSTLRYWGGTAAMMSTKRGCAESPYFADVLVFSLKAEIAQINNCILTCISIFHSSAIVLLFSYMEIYVGCPQLPFQVTYLNLQQLHCIPRYWKYTPNNADMQQLPTFSVSVCFPSKYGFIKTLWKLPTDPHLPVFSNLILFMSSMWLTPTHADSS